MRLSHTAPVAAARFDEPNLVSASGLIPVMRLAGDAGLGDFGGQLLTVPTDKGANAGGKVTALVAGMVAGADSIDDMALLRHGAMGRLFDRTYAPSTLGSFLRAMSFGHVRQLDAVAARFLARLAGQSDLLAGSEGMVLVDIDDSIIEVHGHAKQGASFGYTRVRGLNMLLATASTQAAAPVVVAQRLRKGSCGSPRGAKRLVGDALHTLAHLPSGKFTANSAWLVLAVMAFNLTRAAGTLAGGRLSRATTGTIRRTLITVPARVASSARRLTLHLPTTWPWQTHWIDLFTRTSSPPATATS